MGLDLDFIEIGTSNFETLIQDCNKNVVAVCVEPLTEYIDQLPRYNNVIYINCAISADNLYGTDTIYYIPEKIIIDNKIHNNLKGCNKMGKLHPAHTNYKDLVIHKEVMKIPIGDLLSALNVTSIKIFKIDTEGQDCSILTHLLSYLKTKTKTFWPKEIWFEANELTPREEKESLLKIYEEFYKIKRETTWGDYYLEIREVL